MQRPHLADLGSMMLLVMWKALVTIHVGTSRRDMFLGREASPVVQARASTDLPDQEALRGKGGTEANREDNGHL